MEIKPILPKRKLFQLSNRQLENRMRALTADIQRVAQNYEAPSSPTYRRTGLLARSWSRSTKWEKGDLVGRIVSSGSVATDERGHRYNVYVRGPKTGMKGHRQAAHMRARGWRSVTDIKEQFEPRAEADFKGAVVQMLSGEML